MSDVKYPEATVDLSHTDSNVYAIMGAACRALRRAGVPESEINAMREQMKAGTYDQAIQTVMDWMNVE